jgi:hypothetical protein
MKTQIFWHATLLQRQCHVPEDLNINLTVVSKSRLSEIFHFMRSTH